MLIRGESGTGKELVAGAIQHLSRRRARGYQPVNCPDFSKRALVIAETALGPDHPEVAETLESLSSLYGQIGGKKEADEHARRVARIRATQRGRDVQPEARNG